MKTYDICSPAADALGLRAFAGRGKSICAQPRRNAGRETEVAS